MYTFFLSIHNIMRWVVLIAGVITAVRALIGWFGKRPWESLDDRLGLIFTVSLDIQLLLGVLLYFVLSPITTSALRDFGGAMSNADSRFWAIEHITIMFIAVVLGHVGRALSRRASDSTKKHQRAAIFYTLAVLAILAGTPWFRPLLPF